jgi:sigma-B regulation protein RsbU (phosphoserine phosphatase)
MRALIADDDRGATAMLASVLKRTGLEPVIVHDGQAAWDLLQHDPAPPPLAILDWMMPGLNGLEVCRRIRADERLSHEYILLLTAREGRSDLVSGLEAGADDYVVKPFDFGELRARINVGVRVATLQESLAARVKELQDSLSQVQQLSGLLPICSYCKRIRNDQNYWEQVDNYVAEHSGVRFSHGICPSCLPAVRAELQRGA